MPGGGRKMESKQCQKGPKRTQHWFQGDTQIDRNAPKGGWGSNWVLRLFRIHFRSKNHSKIIAKTMKQQTWKLIPESWKWNPQRCQHTSNTHDKICTEKRFFWSVSKDMQIDCKCYRNWRFCKVVVRTGSSSTNINQHQPTSNMGSKPSHKSMKHRIQFVLDKVM